MITLQMGQEAAKAGGLAVSNREAKDLLGAAPGDAMSDARPNRPRLAGLRTECAIFTIIDSAKAIALAEARARRCGQDPDAARRRALQRHQQTVRDEFARLPPASARVVWRRVMAALGPSEPRVA